MEELVIEAKNGNSKAYTELILLVKNDLYKICKTRLNDDDDIDDAIQETMIQTFKHIKKLKDNKKFKSWIISVLINNCNKIYRKKIRANLLYKKYSLTENEHNFTSSTDIIDDDINFYHLIENLKYEERLIIILYYAERFTFKEISEILNINQNTVKTKLYRTKEKIKIELEGGILNG